MKDGFTPVRKLYVRAPGFFNPSSMCSMIAVRVLRPRIVRGYYCHIAQASSELTHRRALGTVAITSATENSYHPSRPGHFPSSLKHIPQGVVGMSVVDDHGKRGLVGGQRHLFKPPRDSWAIATPRDISSKPAPRAKPAAIAGVCCKHESAPPTAKRFRSSPQTCWR